MQKSASAVDKSARVKAVRLALKLNQEEFGKLLYISKGAVSQIESGLIAFGDKNSEILFSQVKNLNRVWLESGEGEMFTEAENLQALTDERDRLVVELKFEIARLEKHLAEKENQLSEKDKQLTEKDKQLGDALTMLKDTLSKLK